MAAGDTDQNNAFEPQVVYESNPVLLTGETQVFKMWFTEGGFANPTAIRYAESADGDSWTIHGTVLLSDKMRPNIYRENGNYWLYVTDSSANNIELYRSSSEIIQSADLVGTVLSRGSSGWDSANIGNHTVWKEGSTYYMLYEAKNGSTWKIGEATSSTGESFTKSVDNPTFEGADIGRSGGAVGGPDMHVIGGDYYLWHHTAPSGSLPTDGNVVKSTDRRTWQTDTARDTPTFQRTLSWEGPGLSNAQVADLCVVDHASLSNTHLFYAGAEAQSVGEFNIGHASTSQSPENVYNYEP